MMRDALRWRQAGKRKPATGAGFLGGISVAVADAEARAKAIPACAGMTKWLATRYARGPFGHLILPSL
jgi:hypothetical protein